DSLSLVQRVYDLRKDQTLVRPHDLNMPVAIKPRVRFDHGLHIGVVGSINHDKGAAIVSEIAAMLEKGNDGTTLSIIGRYDGWLTGRSVRVTGPYVPEQLPAL